MGNKDVLVHYGCGMEAPVNWINFDSSPTLRIQKIPILGKVIAKNLKGLVFPNNVRYGDIVRGLPISQGTVKAIYCSHVLEHLSFADAICALTNTYRLLMPGGVFRFVMPDLEKYIHQYLESKGKNDPDAANVFMRNSYVGILERPTSFKGRLIDAWGNSHHLWMWDEASMSQALLEIGFRNIKRCDRGDSEFSFFNELEKPSRYIDHLCMECIK